MSDLLFLNFNILDDTININKVKSINKGNLSIYLSINLWGIYEVKKKKKKKKKKFFWKNEIKYFKKIFPITVSCILKKLFIVKYILIQQKYLLRGYSKQQQIK